MSKLIKQTNPPQNSKGDQKNELNQSNGSTKGNSAGSASSKDAEDRSQYTGMIYEDNIDHKTYMIKSSGTIVDISRKKKKVRKIPMSVRKQTSHYVPFLTSPFKNRIPTLFFPYPSYVDNEKETFDRVFFKHQKELGGLTFRFKIAESTNIYNAVVNTCKNAGMYLVNEQLMLKRKRIQSGYDTSSEDSDDIDPDEDDYNLLFTGAVKEDGLMNARSYQKLSHFPHSYNIGRKDAMWKNLSEMMDEFPDDYDFIPKTYVFPQDAEEFEEDRKDSSLNQHGSKLWIFKPSASSCGKGIKVMTKDTPLPTVQKGFVISEYISDPHLIEGLKYDLRIYVLVTSIDPLVVYMYDDGLVRFATGKYTLDESQFENTFVHLTNYSLQKKSETYSQNNTKDSNNLRASKWSLKTLQKVFEDHGKDFKTAKVRMQDVIVKTIISVENVMNKAMRNGTKQKNLCYELYGFDIILDADLKPWILEVNISPSFSSSSPFDKNLKTKLI